MSDYRGLYERLSRRIAYAVELLLEAQLEIKETLEEDEPDEKKQAPPE